MLEREGSGGPGGTEFGPEKQGQYILLSDRITVQLNALTYPT